VPGHQGRHEADECLLERHFLRGIAFAGIMQRVPIAPLAFPQIALVLVRLRLPATMPLSICFN
jgi:hypothetical protein